MNHTISEKLVRDYKTCFSHSLIFYNDHNISYISRVSTGICVINV